MSAEPRPGDDLCDAYLRACQDIMLRIHREEADVLARAAARLADQVAADRLIHIYGPGGHSNLAAQELFYRAGGLMHLSPILDEGTLLSNGALRSTATERQVGYGAAVVTRTGLKAGDVLILVNAFGVNAAVVDAAMAAQARGVFLIGLNSHEIARGLPADHPARHPSGANLQDLVDIAIDTKVPDGDAALASPAGEGAVGPVSTYANAFALNALVLRTLAILAGRGQAPPVWRSRNAKGGEANDAMLVEAMRTRVPSL
jgi:uncharacterized phosphosugar-binding protein